MEAVAAIPVAEAQDLFKHTPVIPSEEPPEQREVSGCELGMLLAPFATSSVTSHVRRGKRSRPRRRRRL